MAEPLDWLFLQKHAVVIAWLLMTVCMLAGIGWMKVQDQYLLPRPLLFLSVPWFGVVAWWFVHDLQDSLATGVTECPWRRCSTEAALDVAPVQFWLYMAAKGFGFVVTAIGACLVLWLALRNSAARPRLGA